MPPPPWPPMERDRRLIKQNIASLTEGMALRKVRVTVRDLLIGEIRRCIEHEIGVTSLVMTVCAIDFLGTLYAGRKATPATFTGFVNDFFPGPPVRRRPYPADTLKHLRNTLVHNYGVPPNIVYTISAEYEESHLTRTGSTRQTLVLVGPPMVDDLDAAAEALFQKARTDSALRTRLLAQVENSMMLNITRTRLL